MSNASQGIMPDSIRIDCRGEKIAAGVVNVESHGRLFQFVIDRKLRQTTTFHAALFNNAAALSDDALWYPEDMRFCALFESPINGCYSNIEELKRRYQIVFTHQRHLLQQGEPFQPLMFGTNWVNAWTLEEATNVLRESPPKSRNVSFMGSIQHHNEGAYSFRREVAQFAMQQSGIDCYGKGIREIPRKREALEPYRFSIAMENAVSDFYFSEKLIDCLLMEAIPIYYGCPGIAKLLDPRGLLTFSSLAELSDIFDDLSPAKYQQLRPFALANKRTVINSGWYSHVSLFQRLADALPDLTVDSEPLAGPPFKGRNRLKSFFRRLVSFPVHQFRALLPSGSSPLFAKDVC